MSVLEAISIYEQELKELHAKWRPFYVEYRKEIVDKTIPLDARWGIFKRAPDMWKESSNWIVHFDCEKMLDSEEIDWYDDFYVDKYETVDMVFLVDERLADAEEEEFSPEFINALREEILEKNLKSFDMDW